MYVVERWLARLGRSPYADDFVLKGGMLLAALGQRRPTVDADALARNLAGDQVSVAARVAEIAALEDPDDGIEFLENTLATNIIRDDALYTGVRVSMDARLQTAVIKFRLDVNFGDPVTPEPRRIELPALRPDTAPIVILGYPIETVIAEKLVTAIDLGVASTRVRDWADLYALTGTHTLDYDLTRRAVQATADYRGSVLRPLSVGVNNFAALRSATYRAYRARLGPDGVSLPVALDRVVAAVVAFADPLLAGTHPTTTWDPQRRRWASRRPDLRSHD